MKNFNLEDRFIDFTICISNANQGLILIIFQAESLIEFSPMQRIGS